MNSPDFSEFLVLFLLCFLSFATVLFLNYYFYLSFLKNNNINPTAPVAPDVPVAPPVDNTVNSDDLIILDNLPCLKEKK